MSSCSELSYNGPQSQSRKLRVSLSVIRGISRSSPWGDFQEWGSRNPVADARNEANVGSDRHPSCSQQGGKVCSSGAPAHRPRRMGMRRAGRGSFHAIRLDTRAAGATIPRGLPGFNGAAVRPAAAASASARVGQQAISCRTRIRSRPSRPGSLALTSASGQRDTRPIHGGLGSNLHQSCFRFRI